MRICEIHIGEFGGITDKHVTLTRGFNLLCGENESGKTTLCNFIKYIFYGFSGSDERSERSSFRTGVSSGYVIIEDTDGIRYRITRYDSEKSKGKVGVFKEPSGNDFNDWKDSAATPGDYFLGVTEKLYTRSVYVSQSGGAALDGGSAEAVSNLLISGDEATNLNKAKTALDGYRKSLKLRRGRGGRIADAEDRLSDLKTAFERGAKSKEELSELNASIKQLTDERETLAKRLTEMKQALAGAKNKKILGLLKTEEELSENYEELVKEKSAHTEKYTVNGFLPDEGYIKEVIAAKNSAKTQLESHEKLKEKITVITEKKMQTVPLGYESYIEMGGADGAKEKYRRICASKRRHELFAIFCSILSVASIVSFFIPDYFAIQLERSITFTVLSTLLALVFGALFITYACKLYKLNKRLSVTAKRPQVKAFEEFEAYDKLHGNDFRSLSDAITESEASAETKLSELNALLGRWGKTSADDAEREYLRYVDEGRELDGRIGKLQGKISYNGALLSVYTPDEIEEAKNTPEDLFDVAVEGVSEKNMTELDIRIENLSGELRELQIKRAEISGGACVDLGKLSAEIDLAHSDLEKLNFNYLAVELAIESLAKAENNIRYTVSPYLSETAGEYFASLTDNRYSGLLLDEKMSLRYRDGETGTPLSSIYLSGGSADLAWICLRLALHKKLSESKPIPIILDECFVYFDDTRLKAILGRLTEMAKADGAQIILFSASSRERDILKDTVKI